MGLVSCGGLRKIPFRCSLPVFEENAFVELLLLFLGFYMFAEAGAFLTTSSL